jgi:hypothetical protein
MKRCSSRKKSVTLPDSTRVTLAPVKCSYHNREFSALMTISFATNEHEHPSVIRQGTHCSLDSGVRVSPPQYDLTLVKFDTTYDNRATNDGPMQFNLFVLEIERRV